VISFSIVKSLIDHYYDYLLVNMDAEVVAHFMISQQLLSEDIVLAAQSVYNKNCLILEQFRLMDMKTLKLLCEILQSTSNENQRNVGETLLNG